MSSGLKGLKSQDPPDSNKGMPSGELLVLDNRRNKACIPLNSSIPMQFAPAEAGVFIATALLHRFVYID